ncbi:MAG: hypothetical protein JXR34_01650 [Bacteroidales bacterium]|nr:hypothetical protein [Bacteroidales bacterium]
METARGRSPNPTFQPQRGRMSVKSYDGTACQLYRLRLCRMSASITGMDSPPWWFQKVVCYGFGACRLLVKVAIEPCDSLYSTQFSS